MTQEATDAYVLLERMSRSFDCDTMFEAIEDALIDAAEEDNQFALALRDALDTAWEKLQ